MAPIGNIIFFLFTFIDYITFKDLRKTYIKCFHELLILGEIKIKDFTCRLPNESQCII